MELLRRESSSARMVSNCITLNVEYMLTRSIVILPYARTPHSNYARPVTLQIFATLSPHRTPQGNLPHLQDRAKINRQRGSPILRTCLPEAFA